MIRKGSAPRRSATADVQSCSRATGLRRGTKLTCDRRDTNELKWRELEPLFGRICALKNKMSAYVLERSLQCITSAYELKSHYQRFSSVDLNAWERQALFHDVVSCYERTLERRFVVWPFRLQCEGSSAWKCERYKFARQNRPAGAARPGTFRLNYRNTRLCSLANYLLRVDITTFRPEGMADGHKLKQAFMEVLAKPQHWQRLLNVVGARQARLVGCQRQLHFKTGTFRVNPRASRMAVEVDETNARHKLWLKMRIGLGEDARFVRLPLSSSQARLNVIAGGNAQNLGFHTEFRLKFSSGRKLHVCTTYVADEPKFLPETHSIGLDLNTKRSFASDHLGETYRLDSVVLDQGLALLVKIDAEGGVRRIGYRRVAQLRRWVRCNEAHIKKLLGRWLDGWKAQGFADVWIEDLAAFGAGNPRSDSKGMALSRHLLLMRLASVKSWLLSMGEKRGIRVHTTNRAFTSQRCPACGHIDAANRCSQAIFRCVECGHTDDADVNAAINILERSKPDLIDVLHGRDRHGRCSPRAIKFSALKALLLSDAEAMHMSAGTCVNQLEHSAGGVSDLPTPAKPTNLGGASRLSGSSVRRTSRTKGECHHPNLTFQPVSTGKPSSVKGLRSRNGAKKAPGKAGSPTP